MSKTANASMGRNTSAGDGGEDPVLDDLEQAERHYRDIKERLERDTAALAEAEARLSSVQKKHDQLREKLDNTQDQVRQERRKYQRQKERADNLAAILKDVHRSIFSGNVYEMILKTCLTITGATAGLYVTLRGDNLRVRAAIEVDGYPQAPPSDYITALCCKVLEDNETHVCRQADRNPDLPEPSTPAEDFRNCMVAPVVLLQDLNGVIIVADKVKGEFDEHDAETLLSVGDQAAVAVENVHLRRALQRAYLATVTTLADAMEVKDPYTHGHCNEVSHYSRLIAEQLDLDPEVMSVVCYAALLHDIGKIGVSDGILNKPAPLLDAERELVRAHVRVGHDLVSNVAELAPVANVILHHHEWWDGSGYPDGLSGEDIPVGARIVGAVDAYCAMITKRSYKDAYTYEHAREELQRCAGTQFDPRVVEAFLAVLDSPREIDVDPDEEPECGVLPGFSHIREYQRAVL